MIVENEKRNNSFDEYYISYFPDRRFFQRDEQYRILDNICSFHGHFR